MTSGPLLSDSSLTTDKDTAGRDEPQKWSPEESSCSTTIETLPSHTIVSFGPGDPENPCNWPQKKKIIVAVFVLNIVFNASISSALPSGGIAVLAKYFNIESEESQVLPVSLYLVGYCCGPLLWGPLSETYGRKSVMIPSFCLFSVSTLGSALAPTYAALLVFRFFVGVGAACAISVIGGVYADIFDDPVSRGRAMAAFMVGNTFGPILGPAIGGFVSTVSWRWSFWVSLIYAGPSFVALVLIPETYGPFLLKRRAQRLRRETSQSNAYAPIELEKKGFKQMATIILTRPIRMFLFEALVFFTCTYLGLIYGILYLYFEAYPIIFQGIYGMSAGVGSLTLLPIGFGALIAGYMFLRYDAILRRAKQQNKHWTSVEEYRRLPLACIDGPLFAISLFWLGWTANPKTHWSVPMLSGVPFGMGMLLNFMALLNYLTDAYEIYAASANGASATIRSIFGVALPFAAGPMYRKLGVHWASSLLGFLSLLMSLIPFAFIKFGPEIRANSKMCQELAERKKIKGNNDARVRDPDEVCGGSGHGDKV